MKTTIKSILLVAALGTIAAGCSPNSSNSTTMDTNSVTTTTTSTTAMPNTSTNLPNYNTNMPDASATTNSSVNNGQNNAAWKGQDSSLTNSTNSMTNTNQ